MIIAMSASVMLMRMCIFTSFIFHQRMYMYVMYIDNSSPSLIRPLPPKATPLIRPDFIQQYATNLCPSRETTPLRRPFFTTEGGSLKEGDYCNRQDYKIFFMNSGMKKYVMSKRKQLLFYIF